MNTEHPISDIFIALDLLVDNGALVKSRTEAHVIERDKQRFGITEVLALKLELLHLVKLAGYDRQREVHIATRRAKEHFAEFLTHHDEMHVGDSDELRPGIYRHFKGDDRLYNVLWSSRNSNSGEITVEYQPLHKGDGGPNNREFLHDHRGLAEFTELIYRPDVGDYFGPRWRLLALHDRPLIAPF